MQDTAKAQFGTDLAALDPAEVDAMLEALPKGKNSEAPATGPGRLSPHQMALWFEDLRANIVRVYMSHPLAMARYGFSGIGYGGDGPRLQGFHDLGVGRVEPWEPRALEIGR